MEIPETLGAAENSGWNGLSVTCSDRNCASRKIRDIQLSGLRMRGFAETTPLTDIARRFRCEVCGKKPAYVRLYRNSMYAQAKGLPEAVDIPFS